MELYYFIGAVLQVIYLTHADNTTTTKCEDGQDILFDGLCDGKQDCRDGSDETVVSCLHIRCPTYAFQCAYGACVNGWAECNGIQDCLDNSDEATLRCEGVLENYGFSGNCSENEFKCKTGECIQEYNACDGKIDCKDSSDETVDLCSALYCPTFAFQCGYGGCVPGNAKCDGVVDCIDSSDESTGICGKGHVTLRPMESTPPNKTVLATTTETVMVFPEEQCFLPPIDNMKFFTAQGDQPLAPNRTVPHLTHIRYECGPHNILEGTSTNWCSNGTWGDPPPKCLKYCSYIPLFGISFSAECEYNGVRIPCDQRLKPGTKAKLSCRTGYRKPNRILRDEVLCDENGEWNYSPYRCKPICGIAAVEDTPETAFPWNVAIYDYLFDHVCGGTIINAKIVVSAAHCFWSEGRNQAIDGARFRVAVGKHDRSYYAKEETSVQIFNISELYIPAEYQGSKLFHQFDIAILVLGNYIRFDYEILPICTKWRRFKHPDREIRSNGAVSSFLVGKDGNAPRSLGILEINQTRCEVCIQKDGIQHVTRITNDKFCLMNPNPETICKWDGGAGFVKYRVREGVKKYTLKGVISKCQGNRTPCTSDYCSICTDIQAYANIIAEYEAKYRPK